MFGLGQSLCCGDLLVVVRGDEGLFVVRRDILRYPREVYTKGRCDPL